jgi:acyl carrier protein
VGYVVVTEGAELAVSELRRHLASQLPEHMIPSVLMALETMPLTPNGKIDRRALPEPDAMRLDGENVYVAPRNFVEETLCGIWEQVLGLERVGIHDNFFALGGHSLLATQVVSRIREKLKMEIPLRRLFELTTVAELAVLVENIDRHQKDGSATIIKKAVMESETETLKQLEQFSDDELDSLLSGMLPDTE